MTITTHFFLDCLLFSQASSFKSGEVVATLKAALLPQGTTSTTMTFSRWAYKQPDMWMCNTPAVPAVLPAICNVLCQCSRCTGDTAVLCLVAATCNTRQLLLASISTNLYELLRCPAQ